MPGADQKCWRLLPLGAQPHPSPAPQQVCSAPDSHCIMFFFVLKLCPRATGAGSAGWASVDAPNWCWVVVTKAEPADQVRNVPGGAVRWPWPPGSQRTGLLLHQEERPSTTRGAAGAPTGRPVASCTPVHHSPSFPAPTLTRRPPSAVWAPSSWRLSSPHLCMATLLPPPRVPSPPRASSPAPVTSHHSQPPFLNLFQPDP